MHKILVSRVAGGLGDQICATVAVRAAQERYGGDDYIVHASTGRPEGHDLFHDQGYCAGGYVPFSRGGTDQYDHHFSLDGPEDRYEKTHNWDASMSRIEIWCRSVDHVPADLCPHWRPTPGETKWAKSWLKQRHLVSGEFVVLHWRCAPGMAYKDIQHRYALAELLGARWPLLVLHHVDKNTPLDPDWKLVLEKSILKDAAIPFHVESGLTLRQLGAVLAMAKLCIGPDSALCHFSAAVDIPFLGVFGATCGETVCRHYPKAKWIQAPIDPKWNCGSTAPCYGVSERSFWCFADHMKGECMERVSPEQIVEEVGDMLLNC